MQNSCALPAAMPSLSEGDIYNKIVVELVDSGGNTDLMPSKGSAEAAGYDLRSSVDHILYSGERFLFPLGFKMQLPRGWYGQIFPRSGHALKLGIMTMAGVIDNDYRGEVMALLYNSGDKPFIVARGDRIAQLVLLQYGTYGLIQGNVSGTVRGVGGLGSTGQK